MKNKLKHNTKMLCIKEYGKFFHKSNIYNIYKIKEYSKTDEYDEIYITCDGHKPNCIKLVRFFIEKKDHNIYDYFIPLSKLRKQKLNEIERR